MARTDKSGDGTELGRQAEKGSVLLRLQRGSNQVYVVVER